MTALEIRKDGTPAVLRKLAKEVDDARVTRRILAIANALDGLSREDAARTAGMDRQTLRDWVLRYNAHGVDGLVDRWNGGRPPTFTPAEQSEIVEIVLAGPDLAKICEQRFGKRMHPWSLGRLLKRLGLSRQKTRPIHPETDPVAAAAFKKRPAPSAINP